GLLIMSETFLARTKIQITGRLQGPDLRPLKRDATPQLWVRPPIGVVLQSGNKKGDGSVVFNMKARESQSSGGWDGRFEATLRQDNDLPLAGSKDAYKVELHNGDETLDTREFYVEEDNPELNDVRPNFAHLYKMAGKSTLVHARMSEQKYDELERTLR